MVFQPEEWSHAQRKAEQRGDEQSVSGMLHVPQDR